MYGASLNDGIQAFRKDGLWKIPEVLFEEYGGNMGVTKAFQRNYVA
jgi:hypothetical protein